MIGQEKTTTRRESAEETTDRVPVDPFGSSDDAQTCSADAESGSWDVAKATLEDFQKRVGETFQLTAEPGQLVDLELVEAVGFGSDSDRPQELRQPFSLLFRGPGEALLPQNLYLMNHPAWGTFALFLVPVGAADGEVRFEAVFN